MHDLTLHGVKKRIYEQKNRIEKLLIDLNKAFSCIEITK